jgi:hypothetical protein
MLTRQSQIDPVVAAVGTFFTIVTGLIAGADGNAVGESLISTWKGAWKALGSGLVKGFSQNPYVLSWDGPEGAAGGGSGSGSGVAGAAAGGIEEGAQAEKKKERTPTAEVGPFSFRLDPAGVDSFIDAISKASKEGGGSCRGTSSLPR